MLIARDVRTNRTWLLFSSEETFIIARTSLYPQGMNYWAQYGESYAKELEILLDDKLVRDPNSANGREFSYSLICLASIRFIWIAPGVFE